jgi:hypothetical protein
MRAKLAEAGIPYREIKVYGSQIMVTTTSAASAERWGTLLGKFATVRAVAREDLDETKESRPGKKKYIKVWRTWATV